MANIFTNSALHGDPQRFTHRGFIIRSYQSAELCRQSIWIIIAVGLEIVVRGYSQVLLVVYLDDIVFFPVTDGNGAAVADLGVSVDQCIRNINRGADLVLTAHCICDFCVRANQIIADGILALCGLCQRSKIITVEALGVGGIRIGVFRIQILGRSDLIPYNDSCKLGCKVGYGRIAQLRRAVDIVHFIRMVHISGEVIAVGNEGRIAVLDLEYVIISELADWPGINTGLAQPEPLVTACIDRVEGDHVVQRLRLSGFIQPDGEVAVESVFRREVAVLVAVLFRNQPVVGTADLSLDCIQFIELYCVIVRKIRGRRIKRTIFAGIPQRVIFSFYIDRLIKLVIGQDILAFRNIIVAGLDQIMIKRISRQDCILLQLHAVPLQISTSAVHMCEVEQEIMPVFDDHGSGYVCDRVVRDFTRPGYIDHIIVTDFVAFR